MCGGSPLNGFVSNVYFLDVVNIQDVGEIHRVVFNCNSRSPLSDRFFGVVLLVFLFITCRGDSQERST